MDLSVITQLLAALNDTGIMLIVLSALVLFAVFMGVYVHMRKTARSKEAEAAGVTLQEVTSYEVVSQKVTSREVTLQKVIAPAQASHIFFEKKSDDEKFEEDLDSDFDDSVVEPVPPIPDELK
jgi:hypothetical protein